MSEELSIVNKEWFQELMKNIKPIFEEEEEIEKSKMSYNIFEVLRIEKREVELHSYFIYDLLNPDSSHGKSALFLKCFLREVLDYSIDELEDFKESDYEVQREVSIGANGRVDFLIKDLKNHRVHIIEMKIEAKDQAEQLIKYDTYAKEKYQDNYQIYYLTLDGREPSEESCEGVEGYKLISFKYHIIRWLEKSLKRLDILSNFRIFIERYLNTIQRITNTIVDDEIKKKYLGCLSNEGSTIKELETLVQESGNIKNQVLNLFNKEVCKELSMEFQDKVVVDRLVQEAGECVAFALKNIGKLKNIRITVSIVNQELLFDIGTTISNSKNKKEEKKKPKYTDEEETNNKVFSRMGELREHRSPFYYYKKVDTLEQDEHFIFSDTIKYEKLKKKIIDFLDEQIKKLIEIEGGNK